MENEKLLLEALSAGAAAVWRPNITPPISGEDSAP